MKVNIQYLNINSPFLINGEEIETESVYTYNPVNRIKKEYILFTLKGKEYVIPERNKNGNYMTGMWTEQAKLASNYKFV